MKRFTFILLVILAISSCGRKTRHIKIGSSVSMKTETVGTYDESTLDAIVRYSELHDDSIINLIIDSGDAVILKKGMGGIVQHAKLGKVQIELLSGKKVWVLYEHIQ